MHPATRQVVLDRMTPRRLLGALLIAHWSAARPDLMELSGAAVSSWTDSIAGYKVSQGTAGFKPIWSPNSFAGYAGVGFDGSDDYLELGPSPLPFDGAPYEVWIRATQDALPADASTRVAFGSGSASGTARRVQRLTAAGVNRAALAIPDGTTATTLRNDLVDFTGRHLLRAAFATGASSLALDGGAPATSAAVLAGTTAARMRIGAYVTSTPSSFWQGVIADVLVTSPLTADQAALLTRLLL